LARAHALAWINTCHVSLLGAVRAGVVYRRVVPVIGLRWRRWAGALVAQPGMARWPGRLRKSAICSVYRIFSMGLSSVLIARWQRSREATRTWWYPAGHGQPRSQRKASPRCG